MAFVQADLNALDAAYKTGALRTRFSDGREVQLGGTEHYLALRRLMVTEIASAAATPVVQHVHVGHRTGIE